MSKAPPPPPADEVERQRLVVIAGHTGDHKIIDAHLNDAAPAVRAIALSALSRLGQCTSAHLEVAFNDLSPRVRARAAELSISTVGSDPSQLLGDPDPTVVEVAAFSCGEISWDEGNAPVEQLSEIVINHDDPLCRESAAAALGAIGDPLGIDAVLTACTDRVTVRRRATLALAAFDDPRADQALHSALSDKDWQVRQAAEDLLEVGRVLDAPPDDDAYAD